MTSTYRWSVAGVNSDDVRRALQLMNAVKSWDAPNHATYGLGDWQVDLFDCSLSTLLINGPTDDSVRDAAGRVGYSDTEGLVNEVEDEVPAR